ncbi:MAG: hypothetical protein JWM08_1744 [Candidatus Angelobacter sp.]|nr:hypothetical protein [Candidatus Angelobacter sp.]
MFCFKCGASMPDDSTVCPQCATPVQTAPTPPPPPSPQQPSVPNPAANSAWLNVPPAPVQGAPQYPPQAQQYAGQYQARTDGKATASLILGVLSLLCFGLLTGLPAIILGHISRGNIERSRGRLSGAGLALTGLILGYVSIVSTVLIIAAIAIPNLLRARISANESSAASTVRTINTVQVTYMTTYPAQGYARDLATLGGDCSGSGTAEHACLIDAALGKPTCTAGVWCEKGPYKYTVSTNCAAPNFAAQPQGDELACTEYVVAATPANFNTGRRSYCSVSDAVIRSRLRGPLDNPPTAEECKEWPPLS